MYRPQARWYAIDNELQRAQDVMPSSALILSAMVIWSGFYLIILCREDHKVKFSAAVRLAARQSSVLPVLRMPLGAEQYADQQFAVKGSRNR